MLHDSPLSLSTTAFEPGRDAGRMLRVLYVEDNPGDVALVRETLGRSRPERFSLEHTGLLSDALAQVQRRAPEVVLLDLQLPDASGLEGLDELRRQFPDVPVIVLTGHSEEHGASEALQRGAQDYLAKGPATAEVLLRAILFAVERSRAERRARPPRPEARDEEIGRASTEVLGRLMVAAIHLDSEGRVLWMNEAAKEALAAPEGLRVASDRTLLCGRSDAETFQACLQRAVSGSSRRVEILSLQRGGARRPLSLLILPRGSRRPGMSADGSATVAATLLLTDPDHLGEAAPRLLRRLYQFTAAEARLGVLLAQGVSSKEAAERLGVSWNTVRFHLRSLFAKTGTSRQGELVRLLGSGVLEFRIGDGE